MFLTETSRARACARARVLGQVAAISGQKRVVQRLVELKADVNARDAQVGVGGAANVLCSKHVRHVHEYLRACMHTLIQCVRAGGRAKHTHTHTHTREHAHRAVRR